MTFNSYFIVVKIINKKGNVIEDESNFEKHSQIFN